jgi:FkbM family methyltransferase
MGVRRLVRRYLEKALEVDVIPTGDVAYVFEWQHLRKFFAHFQIDCVFDVGANAGQYASMLRTRAGYRGQIISYEPIPELAAEMRRAATHDPAWAVEELALDRNAGQVSFNVFASDRLSSLHAPSHLAQQRLAADMALVRQIKVRADTLANELGRQQTKLGFKRPYLKMDTQGHDLQVAMGAGKQLREFIGLQSELAIERLYAETPGYEEALAYYRDQGFVLSALVPNNLGHFPRLLEIDCIMYRA